MRTIPRLCPVPHSPQKPTPFSRADKEKEEGDWRVVGRCRGKSRTAIHQSQHDPKDNGIYSPILLISSKGDAPDSYEKTGTEVLKLNEPVWKKILNLRNSNKIWMESGTKKVAVCARPLIICPVFPFIKKEFVQPPPPKWLVNTLKNQESVQDIPLPRPSLFKNTLGHELISTPKDTLNSNPSQSPKKEIDVQNHYLYQKKVKKKKNSIFTKNRRTAFSDKHET